MTKSEFFSTLSEMDVNMPFFMYAEEAADGLNRLNQQRKWMERPEGKIPTFNVDYKKLKKSLLNQLMKVVTSLQPVNQSMC